MSFSFLLTPLVKAWNHLLPTVMSKILGQTDLGRTIRIISSLKIRTHPLIYIYEILLKQQLYYHIAPISQTIQVRWIRHAAHCWKIRDMKISCELLHMDTPVLASQQKLIFISSVQTLNADWRTCQKWWMIGIDGEKESRESVLPAQLDDDSLNAVDFGLIFLVLKKINSIKIW